MVGAQAAGAAVITRPPRQPKPIAR
jgi:hypothetical protein